jgi:hypothetical protein
MIFGQFIHATLNQNKILRCGTLNITLIMRTYNQSELLIPTIEQGRRYALSFYCCGKIIGSIRDALRARDQFHIVPHDAVKLSSYIEFLGANHPEVKEFISYDKNTRHIENNTETLKEMFHKEYILADTNPKREWLYDSLFRRIQNKEQLDRSARDLLYDQAKVVYCDYHYHLYLHGRIDFYSKARTHSGKKRHSSTYLQQNLWWWATS